MKPINEFYRDEYSRKSRPVRYSLLNSQGENISSSPLELKTTGSVKAFIDHLNRSMPYDMSDTIAVYDTKTNKVIEVIFKEGSLWRATSIPEGWPKNIQDMFHIKPKANESLTELDSSATIQNLIAEPLELLKVKVLEMLRANTDPKWQVELTKLKTILIQAEDMANTIHKKLGNIPLPMGMYESNLHEAASQEAYALHRMTDIGQDAAQNFIEANPNINLKKLMSDLVRDKAYRYIVRDIVKGTADKVYIKQFTRKYGELAEARQVHPVVMQSMQRNAKSKTVKLDSFSGSDSEKIIDFLNSEKISFKKLGPIFTITLDRNTPKASVILSQLRRIAKFDEINESNNPVTELVESIVTQTILEMYQPVSFDPSIHKTLEVGAVDYELDPTGEILYAYMPFKEETENAVTVPFKKEYIESFANVEINSQEDLDAMDHEPIDKFVKSAFRRPDSNQILKKVLVMKESKINELKLTSLGVKEFLMFLKKYPKYFEELGFDSFKTLLRTIQTGDVNIVHDFIQELKPLFAKETNPEIKRAIAAISESLNLK